MENENNNTTPLSRDGLEKYITNNLALNSPAFVNLAVTDVATQHGEDVLASPFSISTVSEVERNVPPLSAISNPPTSSSLGRQLPSRKLSDYLPEDRWWQLYINPEDHEEACKIKDPGSLYDGQRSDSKGYQQSMVDAYRNYLDIFPREPITSDIYQKMHDAVISSLDEEVREKKAKPSGKKSVEFGLGSNGIAADLGELNRRHLLVKIGKYDREVNNPVCIYFGSPYGLKICTNYTLEERASLIKEALRLYHLETEGEKEEDELLRGIARVIRTLHIMHPFVDANGRLNINLLLPRLLLDHGFPPIVPKNMSTLFSGSFTIDEIVTKLKEEINTSPAIVLQS